MKTKNRIAGIRWTARVIGTLLIVFTLDDNSRIRFWSGVVRVFFMGSRMVPNKGFHLCNTLVGFKSGF